MLFEMFKTFFKIGAFTFGGGYAMIPIIQEEIVTKRKWMTEADFLDAIVVAQGSPGPLGVNISIYVGYKVKGISGALSATIGSVLPSFLIILLVASFFYKFRNNRIVDKVFLGIGPAIVGLIGSAVYQLTRSSNLGYVRMGIGLMAALAIVFLKISPIYLVILGGLGSVIINMIMKKDKKI